MNDASLFFDSWELFEPGVLAGVIVGATLGLLGVYVVLRRLVFLSAAVGQTASFGVVLALYLATLSSAWWVPSPAVGAVLVTFAGTLFVARRTRRSEVVRDGLLGGMFLLGAAGTVLLGSHLPQEMHEIEALLHGVGVSVEPSDLTLVAALGGFVLFVHALGWRAFAAVAFDPIGAQVRRVPVRVVDIALALTLALAIAAGIRALGALPVFALSILPSLAAIRLARTLPGALVLGALLGAATGFIGYFVAFLFDLPVGASQTAVAILVALLVEVGRAVAGLARGREG